MAVLTDFYKFGKYFPAPIRRGWKAFIDTIVGTGGGTPSGPWKWSTLTLMADPGAGYIRGNAADPTLITQLAVSATDTDGIDRSALLGAIRQNDAVSVSSTTDADGISFTAAADPIDNGTWWAIPVTYYSHFGLLADNEDIEFSVVFTGANTFLQLLDTPNTYAGARDEFVMTDPAIDQLIFVPPATAGTKIAFLMLYDTPSSYAGHSLKTLRVTLGENAVEFGSTETDAVWNAASIRGTPVSAAAPTDNDVLLALAGNWVPTELDFLVLTDTPGTYAGAGGSAVTVSTTEDGLEFVSLTPSVLTWDYRWSTATTPPPALGRAAANNADPALATALYVNQTDLNNVDRSLGLGSARAGDIIGFTDFNSSKSYVYQITAAPIDGGTYFEYPVVNIRVNGLFANNERGFIAILFYGANEFLELLDTPSSYAGHARKIVKVNDAEDALIFDDEPMTWRDRWTSQPYEKNDVVLDPPWTMVANKDTTDRAAPQPYGSTEWLLPETPAWIPRSYVGVVWTGVRIFNILDELYLLSKIRVWIPDVTSTYQYRIFIENNLTGELTPFQSFQGSDVPGVGWLEFSISGLFVGEGDDLVVWLVTENSASTTTFTHPWNRVGNSQQDVDPGTGNWNRDNQSTRFRINDFDSGLTDRGTDLDQVTVGTVIRATSQADANAWSEFQVNTIADNGGWRQYGVTFLGNGPNGEPGVGACFVKFDIPVAAGADYVELTDEYAAVPSVSGQIAFDSGAPVDNQNAYGVDVEYTQYVASDDWDVLAYAGSAGGVGGGGGVTEYFTELLDTPANYVGHGGKYVTVRGDELGLEFITGGGGGATTFLELNDTPSSYAGHESKVLRVNTAANAVEFGNTPEDAVWNADALRGEPVSIAPPGADDVLTYIGGQWTPSPAPGGVSTFLELTDTPSSYALQGSRYLRVNSAANAVEFGDYASTAVWNAGSIQGRSVAATVPNNRELFRYETSQWAPYAPEYATWQYLDNSGTSPQYYPICTLPPSTQGNSWGHIDIEVIGGSWFADEKRHIHAVLGNRGGFTVIKYFEGGQQRTSTNFDLRAQEQGDGSVDILLAIGGQYNGVSFRANAFRVYKYKTTEYLNGPVYLETNVSWPGGTNVWNTYQQTTTHPPELYTSEHLDQPQWRGKKIALAQIPTTTGFVQGNEVYVGSTSNTTVLNATINGPFILHSIGASRALIGSYQMNFTVTIDGVVVINDLTATADSAFPYLLGGASAYFPMVLSGNISVLVQVRRNGGGATWWRATYETLGFS